MSSIEDCRVPNFVMGATIGTIQAKRLKEAREMYKSHEPDTKRDQELEAFDRLLALIQQEVKRTFGL